VRRRQSLRLESARVGPEIACQLVIRTAMDRPGETLGRAMETLQSFEARSAPSPYPECAMCRLALTTCLVVLVILAALMSVPAIAAESGCADGTREALTDPQRFPDIAACAGTWAGHVSNAHHLCGPGWNVCSSNFDIAKLMTITFDDAVAVDGCFAFNAAQDNFSCIPCTGAPLAHDMGGIGTGCHAGARSPSGSCITGGRIDVLSPSEVTPATACQFAPGVTTGVLCCVSQCGNGMLDPGEECDDGNLDAGDCCSPTCQFEEAGTLCRPSAGECDPAETCTGASGTCPVDAKSRSGTPCSDDGNPCTTDLCDGIRAACVHAAGNARTVCRPSAGECDPEEKCTGASGTCPVDAKLQSGTPCSDDGSPCTTDLCDGIHAACMHAAGNAGTVCRPSAGVCDVAEACGGTTATCPPDRFESSSTVCRPAASECEVADFCPGDGPDCTMAKTTPGAKYDETLQLQCPGSCAVEMLIAERLTCVEANRDAFRSCVDDCPGFAGRCTITRDCVNKCRDELTLGGEECIQSFEGKIRKCNGGRHCLAAARQARRRFRRCLRSAAPRIRTGTVGTEGVQVSGVRPSLNETESCQEACVRGVVGTCFDDCQDRCEGDHLALKICRQACKDAQCGELHAFCNCQRGIDCEASAASRGRQ